MTEIKKIEFPPGVSYENDTILDDKGSHITEGNWGKYKILVIRVDGEGCNSFGDIKVGDIGWFSLRQ